MIQFEDLDAYYPVPLRQDCILLIWEANQICKPIIIIIIRFCWAEHCLDKNIMVDKYTPILLCIYDSNPFLHNLPLIKPKWCDLVCPSCCQALDY